MAGGEPPEASTAESTAQNGLRSMADIVSSVLSGNLRGLASPFRRAQRPRDALQRSLHHTLQDTAKPHLRKKLAGSKGLSQLSVGRFRRLQHSLKPKGPGNNDRSRQERAINVLTSLPFLAVGLHTRRARKTPEGKHYSSTLLAVGGAATAYHAASGPARPHLRKLDYWTIAAASTQLLRALFPAPCCQRRALHAASLALMPFQPMAVSTLNFGLAEVEFARTAMRDRELRGVYRRHAAVGSLGLGCFALEDAAISRGLHFVHSLWHLQAAYAVASANALLRRREQDALLGKQPQEMVM